MVRFPGRSLTLLLAALGACGVPLLRAPAHAPSNRWHLVERDTPGGPQLVLEADTHFEVFIPEGIEVRLQRTRAGVGERVDGEAWRPKAQGRWWLELYPTRPGVRLLGRRAFLVDGDERIRFAFTRESGGRGGVSLVVRE